MKEDAKDDWGGYAGDYASARPASSAPPLVGRSVVLNGLIARPELNGTRGIALSFNPETGRYNVQMPKGEFIALKPANLTSASEGGGMGGSGGGGRGSAEAEAAKATAKKASIGARMAQKRNAKGIAWSKAGGDGGGLSGMFASDEKRQEVAARRANNPISEDYDPMTEAEAARHAGMSQSEIDLERKAIALKEMATKHLGGMDIGRALSFLTDAIAYCPKMKELYGNRSHAYEMLHDHENALADGEKAIDVDPEWPKGYLRTARALMSLERGAEAASRLRRALEIAPRDDVLLGAYKEAMVLAQCTERTEKAIRASKLQTFNGVGDEDIVGILRGACKRCDCNAYIQKHGRTTVLLMGRGHVRQDNDPSFYLCARCGHDCCAHVDVRLESTTQKKKPKKGEKLSQLPRAPESMPNANLAKDSVSSGAPERYTNAGAGTRGVGNSPYYYAHQDGRPRDYTVPTVPKTIGADGELKPWHAAGGRAGAAGAAERDEWEEAEVDPSLLRDVDPFAAAGSGGGGGATDVSDPLDPLACVRCAK